MGDDDRTPAGPPGRRRTPRPPAAGGGMPDRGGGAARGGAASERAPDRGGQPPERGGGSGPLGVAAADLSDEELVRELASLHRTRHEALRHRPGAALGHHDRRSHELEAEYLRRFPEREVPPGAPEQGRGSGMR